VCVCLPEELLFSFQLVIATINYCNILKFTTYFGVTVQLGDVLPVPFHLIVILPLKNLIAGLSKWQSIGIFLFSPLVFSGQLAKWKVGDLYMSRDLQGVLTQTKPLTPSTGGSRPDPQLSWQTVHLEQLQSVSERDSSST